MLIYNSQDFVVTKTIGFISISSKSAKIVVLGIAGRICRHELSKVGLQATEDYNLDHRSLTVI